MRKVATRHPAGKESAAVPASLRAAAGAAAGLFSPPLLSSFLSPSPLSSFFSSSSWCPVMHPRRIPSRARSRMVVLMRWNWTAATF